MPIIYGGIGGLTYSLIVNHRGYKEYLTLYHYYIGKVVAKPGMPYYSLYKYYIKLNVQQQQIIDNTNSYNRNFQLCILGLAGVYAIQLVDAYIDAKFIHSFSMDNLLGIRIYPGLMSQPAYAGNIVFKPGINLTMNF